MQITEKQLKYLNTLLKNSPYELNKKVEDLSKFEAMNLIGFLKDYNQENPKPLDDKVKGLFIIPEEKTEEDMPNNLFPLDEDEDLPF